MDKAEFNHFLEIIKDLNYDKQDHWDIFNELFLKKISNFDSMRSFRTNGLSNMIETGLPSQEQEEALKGKSYSNNYSEDEIEDIEARFNQLKEMMGSDIENIPFNSLIGNPRRYAINLNNKEYLLNFDDLYHVYSAWQIKRTISFLNKTTQSATFLEIGGGYGALASKLTSIYKNIKYIIIDLPEVLLIQNYYLKECNPSLNIINLLERENLTNKNYKEEKFDVLLIPFNIYKKIKLNFDVAINTRSFGEMPRNILHDYIRWIEDNINSKGLLYNTNRYVFTKSIDKNKLRDYPYDNFWRTIISQPQWLQTHLHEFLLQRTEKESEVPLSFSLQSFPLTTPPPGPIMDKIQTQKDWLYHQQVK